MGRTVKAGLLALVSIGIAWGMTAGPAGAGGGSSEGVRTKVSIDHTCPMFNCRRRGIITVDFTGFVRSRKDECEAIRKVKLFKVDGEDVRVGKTVSDVDGSWEISIDTNTAGKYRAVVRKETKSGTVCKTGKSEKDTVSPEMM